MRKEPSFSGESETISTNAVDGVVNSEQELNSDSEASELLSDYRQRYGLSVDPFVDDQHFPLYTGGQRSPILDQLLHLCQFSNNLLVVLGGGGVGKTRMAQALIDALDDADDICFLEGEISSTFDSLFSGVLDQFELPDAETFHEFVKRKTDADGLAVLIVDNAHHLTDEVLLQLINLIRSGEETRVHLVLFAETHFLPRLQSFSIGDVVLSDFQLIKFSLAETVDYLNFRMEMADYLGPEIFTETNVEPWWRESKGQLLELHEFAQAKLLASVSSTSGVVGYARKGLPVAAVVGASALGALLIMGLMYWGDKPSESESMPLTTLPTTTVASSVTTQVSSAINPIVVPSESAGVASNHIASSAEAVAMTDVAAQNNQESPVVTQSVVPLVQTNSLPRSTVGKAVSSQAAAAAAIEKIEVVADSAAVKNPDVPHVEKVSPIPTAASSYSEQEKILLSWGGAEFTLQLMGLSSEAAMTKFVAQQPNRKDLLVFKSLRKGKDWFVAVTGRYPSAAKAQQAIKLLPDEQQKAKPWSRDLKTIQSEIKSK